MSDLPRVDDPPEPQADASRNAAPVRRTDGAGAWVSDILAGATGAVATMAAWLTLAMLAYAALGPGAAAAGVRAACAAVTIGAFVVAWLGRSVMPTGAPSSATTLIFAAAVARLATDPALQPLSTPAHLTLLVAAASGCVVLMGLLQMLLGLLRLGSVARYVPQPVLAGFMNGVALLALLAPLPALLGISGGAGNWRTLLAQAQPGALAIALATPACAFLVARTWPRAPSALVGLAFGCLLFALVHAAWPGISLGPLVGPLPPGVPLPDVLLPLLESPGALGLLRRHANLLVTTALALAVVGSLESVLNALAIDRRVNARHNPNRELLAFGIGNVASGLFGGLPLSYLRSRAAVLLDNGARSRRAAMACAVLTALLVLAAGDLIALLPLGVVGGLMVVVAWGLVDRSSLRWIARALRGRLPREMWLDLALMLIVFAVTLSAGFVAGVAFGVLLATGLFIRAMNRSLIRSRYRGDRQPSRRIYPPMQEHLLQTARRQIQVFELEGALFFGNADLLAAQVEALDEHSSFVVLDLRRVSTLDPSGAQVLAQMHPRLAARRCTLLLAGVTATNRHGRVLTALDLFGAPSPLDEGCFEDVDRAVEHAEQRLLRAAGLMQDQVPVPLADCMLLHGIDEDQIARLGAEMPSQHLKTGDVLFREGDPGDRLYVLTQGSITVRSDEAHGAHRFVSFSPGMMLGEVAMLDGQGRTADAMADTPSIVHVLTRETFDRLARDEPALARQLAINIARHLSARLRQAGHAWRVAAG